jgi:hypothetical protein
MNEHLGSIFPERFVPPFLRSQFVVEEIIQTKIRLAGHYDPAIILNGTVSYRDPHQFKTIMLVFHDGDIWKVEKPRQAKYKSVVLGDDARYYDSGKGEALPPHVRALSFEVVAVYD